MPAHRKELNIKGPNLWYLVGLITSDGCLSKDGRHVDITSSDYEFLSKIKNKFSLTNRIGTKNKEKINLAYYIQISNKNFYDFLLSVGLIPNKSLTLGRLDVPKEFFNDFLRGLIDGDGSLRSWRHVTNLHVQWSLSVFSASEVFIRWLQATIEAYLGCRGKIHSALRPNRINPIYTLKYGKMVARVIAKNCYYKGCFGLDRKIRLAQDCLGSYKGWVQSKTVFN
ncbi:MAG: LAGLIDADG family homing endonuclease [Candidatus Omnitrophica bacterium]|nr:LAGLIDADG family homing endonuclease [Candidatus Omnitrophota bacterium]MBU4303030.1 LAGLIDADG family homing endonuclease [Candidatus Omnitrophota bacterium]MBU4467265.1 LAGLIDADG family homing endonuclease [Candidatus Omnitrophota bacterium]MCG2707385.1 LAGLIDADG family homing endonuclease [Candidatus Omnitrophota bacterium]